MHSESRNDFDPMVHTIRFDPSLTIEDIEVVIPIFNDDVNEPEEGFLVVLEVSVAGGTEIDIVRNSSIVAIIDNDRK